MSRCRERVNPPELLDERTPTNVIARRAGFVLEVRDWNGIAAVLPGSAVTEGQLLISGVEDLETLGARVRQAWAVFRPGRGIL